MLAAARNLCRLHDVMESECPNEAGESDRVYVGGFVAGGEGFCDPGPAEPPPGF